MLKGLLINKVGEDLFERAKSLISKVVSKIFPNKNIENKLDIDIDMSDEIAEAIELWTKMYEDNPPWLEEEKLQSLNIPSSIASELARLVTIEMKSEVTGKTEGESKAKSERATFLNNQYQKVIDKIRVNTEYACAKGGIIFKPFVDGKNIAVDYIQQGEFYPVKFNSSGDLIAAIFPDTITVKNKTYTRLEYHHLMDNGIYYISNKCYNEVGKEIELTEVEAWKDVLPEVNLKKVERPLFAYFKMPLANNVDSKSNIGVSVYSKAVNIIKEIDRQYTKILWEYEGTELALDVALDMFKVSEGGGSELPKGKERLFRKLDTEDENFYKVFNPDIRDEPLYNGLNKLLKRAEFNCGLAYGTLSDIEVVEKTAEEIKASKQRSYSTVVDIQKSLRVSLDNLLYAMNYLANNDGLGGKGEYEVSFEFDDSIIIDNKTEQAIMMQEVAAGLIKPEKYLMERYGVTEEQAKDMLPSVDDKDEKNKEDEVIE